MVKIRNAKRLIQNAKVANNSIARFSKSTKVFYDLQKVDSKTIYKQLRDRQKQIERAAKQLKRVEKIANKAGKVTDALKGGKFKAIGGSIARIASFVLPLISLGLSVGNFLVLKQINQSTINNIDVLGKSLDIVTKSQGKLDSRIKANKKRIDILNDDADLFNSQIINNRKLIKDNLEINKTLNSTLQKSIRSFDKQVKSVIKQANSNFLDIRKQIKELQNRTKLSRTNTESLNKARIAANTEKIAQLTAKTSSIDASTQTFENRILDNAKNVTINRNSINNLKRGTGNVSSRAMSSINAQIRLIKQRLNQQKNIDVSAEVAKQLTPAINKQVIPKIKPEIDNQLAPAIQAALKPQTSINRSLKKDITKNKADIKKLDKNKLNTSRFDGFEVGFPSNVLRISRDYMESRLKEFENQLKIPVTSNPIYEALIRINRENIKKLTDKLNLQEKVNDASNLKLDQIAALLTLIPAKAADATTNKLATRVPDWTAAGVCKTTRPGGCMTNALNSNSNGLKDFMKGQFGNVLDKLNAAANAAQLALLKKIDFKLGAQIGSKGISGAIKNMFENKLVDRAMAAVTLATTMHNALQLSNNLTQTLFSATDNLLKAFGVKIKDEKGAEIGIQQVVNRLTLNFANTLFGVENVKSLTYNLKKANRIYQAGANIVDSVRSMTDSVKNVTEFTAENTGKIGNALKTYQVIAPDAYQWMPEQVNAQSVWVQRLNNLNEAAEGINMVSGELLSITENANEIKKQLDEFNKVVEEKPPKERKDNKPVADKKAAEKAASVPPAVPDVGEDTFKKFLG